MRRREAVGAVRGRGRSAGLVRIVVAAVMGQRGRGRGGSRHAVEAWSSRDGQGAGGSRLWCDWEGLEEEGKGRGQASDTVDFGRGCGGWSDGVEGRRGRRLWNFRLSGGTPCSEVPTAPGSAGGGRWRYRRGARADSTRQARSLAESSRDLRLEKSDVSSHRGRRCVRGQLVISTERVDSQSEGKRRARSVSGRGDGFLVKCK